MLKKNSLEKSTYKLFSSWVYTVIFLRNYKEANIYLYD